MNTPEQLRNEIAQIAKTLEAKKQSLANLERQCKHDWDKTQDASIYHEGYSYAGDPVGTMGVDWRPGGYVPSRTERRWSRKCKCCGVVQYTAYAEKKKVTATYDGRSVPAEIDEPVFSNYTN